MRRYLPDALKKNPEPPTASASGEFVLDLRIPLQCITPVFGGGVETRIPDQVEALRIPRLRGGLRALWRAVTDYGEDDLFRREAALFGGVSLGVLRGPDALRSRLVLSVTVDDSGKCEAAGVHLKGPRGDFKALPQWDRRLGQDLGYALFPLQIKEADRKAADRKQPSLATHELRYGLRFTLRVRLRARSGLPGGAPDAQVIEELLWALCALVHFGGVGVRQSRGFGALSLQEDQIVTGLDAFGGYLAAALRAP